MIVIFWFIESDINRLFPFSFFDLIVISRGKSTNINNGSCRENFVINQRWKVKSTKSEPNMTFGSSIKKISFSTIDTFQKFKWVTFLPKVNQIFIISVDSNISIASPCFLNFLCCYLIFGLEFNFLLSFQESSPCPLDLNSGNMIHRKSMIFKKSSGQGHFVCSLNYSSTIVSQTLIFIRMNNIKLASQKLLSQLLCCRQMSILIS